MDAATQQQLITAALAARAHAYAPYSKFQVGAAVLDERGTITAGANVENASSGLTVCAERVAVAGAVAAGARHLSAVAVVSRGGCTPCGACRQVLAEFGRGLEGTLEVVLVDANDLARTRVTTLEALLPEPFAKEPSGDAP
jgi:cytidine deaminase